MSLIFNQTHTHNKSTKSSDVYLFLYEQIQDKSMNGANPRLWCHSCLLTCCMSLLIWCHADVTHWIYSLRDQDLCDGVGVVIIRHPNVRNVCKRLFLWILLPFCLSHKAQCFSRNFKMSFPRFVFIYLFLTSRYWKKERYPV